MTGEQAAEVLAYLADHPGMTSMILGLLMITACVTVAIIAGMRDSARRRHTTRRRRRPPTAAAAKQKRTGELTPRERATFDAIVATYLTDLEGRRKR